MSDTRTKCNRRLQPARGYPLDDSSAPMLQIRGLVVVAFGTALLGCGSSPSTPSTGTQPAPSSSSTASPSTPSSTSVTAVTVAGTAPAVGGAAQFTATAAVSDGSTRSVTTDATWQSSNVGVATVTGGMVAAVASGETDISATYQSVTGKLHVTITAGPVTAATLSLIGVAPTVGAASQFTATVTFSDNTSKIVTPAASWTSSNTSVATVSNGTMNTGLVTGVAAGQADISATYQGVKGTVHLTIASAQSAPAAPTVTLISLLGSAPSIGATSQYKATATLSDRTFRDVTSLATWRSFNPAIATVTNGAVTGVAAGETEVTATYENTFGSMIVVIRSSACVTQVSPTTLSLPASGGPADLTVSVSGSNCSWTATTSDPFVTITRGASGNTSGLVQLSVSANAGAARTGALTIAGQRVSIFQAAGQTSQNCTVTLLPASADYSAEYHEAALTISVAAHCPWTASISSPFIAFSNPITASPGEGSGSFIYKVFGNLTGVPRSGSITVGQQTITITQHAALGGNSLSFVSDPGFVGEGGAVLYEAPTATFRPSLDSARNRVSMRVDGSTGRRELFWTLDLSALEGQELTRGTYSAVRSQSQGSTVNPFNFSGDGRGCNPVGGQFTITDFVYSADGLLQRLSVTFDVRCDSQALRGNLVYVR